MRINEVTQHVDLSKRAVKYYEDQGLLQVDKDENGYRNYSEKNVETLKEISLYGLLGISIRDIRHLMNSNDRDILKHIYREKLAAHETGTKELEALHAFMEHHDAGPAEQSIDYQTIAQALQDMVPGFYGYYFTNHFMPYLQIQAVTREQQQAYRNIVDFWDNTRIRIPLMMRLASWLMYRLMPRPTGEQLAGRMDAQLKKYLNPSEDEYAKLRRMTAANTKLKNSFPMKYHPTFLMQRRFMKQLQEKEGIFPLLSPCPMILLHRCFRRFLRHGGLNGIILSLGDDPRRQHGIPHIRASFPSMASILRPALFRPGLHVFLQLICRLLGNDAVIHRIREESALPVSALPRPLRTIGLHISFNCLVGGLVNRSVLHQFFNPIAAVIPSCVLGRGIRINRRRCRQHGAACENSYHPSSEVSSVFCYHIHISPLRFHPGLSGSELIIKKICENPVEKV